MGIKYRNALGIGFHRHKAVHTFFGQHVLIRFLSKNVCTPWHLLTVTLLPTKNLLGFNLQLKLMVASYHKIVILAPSSVKI